MWNIHITIKFLFIVFQCIAQYVIYIIIDIILSIISYIFYVIPCFVKLIFIYNSK